MISEVSKQDIIDILIEGMQNGKFFYYGRMGIVAFLDRVVPLNELQSTDIRYKMMKEDIQQHTIRNHDWPEHWVFDDDRINLKNDEENFKKILEEVFHPLVLKSKQESVEVFNSINEILKIDGYCLAEDGYISNRPKYKVKKLSADKLYREYGEAIKEEFNSSYIDKQIDTMLKSIESDPDLAIGKSKELIESCCKTILNELEVVYKKSTDFNNLYSMTLKELGLNVKKQDNSSEVGQISKKI